MYRKILLATDGSPSSKAAEQHAMALARLCKASVVALSVLYSELSFEKSRFEAVEEQRGKARELFSALKKEARKNRVKLATKLLEGPPWTKIADEAESGKCDLIVMGSRGKGALGSVAEKVVRNASLPVLVVKGE